jgi:hypothetical protein
MLRRFFSLPIRHPMALGLVLVVALAVIFVPSVEPSDWELNTTPLFQGMDLYQSGDFVYPPWSLLLLWPYRLMTAVGARIAAVLVLAALCSSRNWSIGRFLSVVINPFFIFSMLYSNLDLLVFGGAILLWEKAADSKWRGLLWGLALSLLLLKPQGALFVMPYLFWQQRHHWRSIALALFIAGLVTIPISVLGSPALLFQWIDNIRNPSQMNLDMWAANNISLSHDVGLLWAALILGASFGGMYVLMRSLGKEWTVNHNYLVLIMTSLLISPYASNQSVVAAMAFAPSVMASLLQYAMTFVGTFFQIYLPYVPFWIIGFSFVAIWFLPTSRDTASVKP